MAKAPETAQIGGLKMHLRGSIFQNFLTLWASLRWTQQRSKSRLSPSEILCTPLNTTTMDFGGGEELDRIPPNFLLSLC